MQGLEQKLLSLQIYIKYSRIHNKKQDMSFDIFEAETADKSLEQQINPPHDNNDDQFDYGASYEAPGIKNQGSHNSGNQGSFTNFENVQAADSETIRKLREEEDEINKKLRQKSQKQYEAKKKRKEQGSKQLQQFLGRKQDERRARKQENKQKQKQKLKEIQKLSSTAGWQKVAANVSLKQGEATSKKDTARMREAIINKKQDQS